MKEFRQLTDTTKPFSFDVFVPFEPCQRLGVAYNRCMELAKDWVLLLDSDLFLANPNWYDICLYAIKKLGYGAGWISGVTNHTACGGQSADNYIDYVPDSNDLSDHIVCAKRLFDKYGAEPVEKYVDTGCFILTHRQAWEDVGGFIDMFHVDTAYCHGLLKAGYKLFALPGLYFFHLKLYKKELWGGLDDGGFCRWKNLGKEWRIL